MSYRTLIEINHDYGFKIEEAPARFVEALGAYLASASKRNAELLEPYGIRVVGIRHHSGNFILDGTPEGFPPQYLEPAKKASPIAP